MADAVPMDLGVGDVHAPGAAQIDPSEAAQRALEYTMSDLTTSERKALPSSAFADPANRAYPISDAAHVRNAAARLEQQKGSMSPAEYRRIRSRIARAAKKFGVESEYNKKRKASRTPSGGVRMTYDHPEHGRFEIRHMSGLAPEKVICGPMSLADEARRLAASDTDAPVWIELAIPGTYYGHPRGPFQLNRQVFDTIIRNFKSNPDAVNPERGVTVDWEHASELPPEKVANGGAPAAGWIKDLAVRNGALHALVRWGDKAREQIRKGEYKGISPAIAFKSTHPVTGEEIGPELTSAGLTNQPFLRGMERLAARRDGAGVSAMARTMTASADEYMPVIREALMAHPYASREALMGHLDDFRDMVARSGGAAMVDGVDVKTPMSRLRALANVSLSTSDEDALDIIEDVLRDLETLEEHEEEEIEEGAERADMSRQGGAAATQITKETMPMAQDNDTIALSAKVTALEAANKALSDKAAKTVTLEGEVTTLSAKVDELTKKLGAAESENKRLLSAQEAYENEAIERRVDEALADYPDRFSKSQREVLVTMRKAGGAEAFDKLAPRKSPQDRALMSRQVPAEPAATAPSSLRGGVAKRLTAVDLAKKIAMKAGKPVDEITSDDIDRAASLLADNPLGINL